VTNLILKDATTYFSRGTPNLPTVIPAMDYINGYFTDMIMPSSRTNPAIRVAMEIAKKTLNRYYSSTDASEIYQIAMVLHPRHKLAYFRSAGWKEKWVKAAEKLVRDRFKCDYPELETEDAGGSDSEDSVQLVSPSGNIFDNLLSLAPLKSSGVVDEIGLYLSVETENVMDPIKWWCEKRKTYPRLSRMALDYLTIPATSVDVERLFSHGRIILTDTRSGLSVASKRALLCLGSWISMGLVRDGDVNAVASLDEIQGKIELDKLGNLLRART